MSILRLVGELRVYFAPGSNPSEEQLANAKAMQLRSLPYSAYLKTPHWTNKKRLARAMANYRCARCNERRSETVKLEVHHLTYERVGCEELSDLEVLCAPCHRKAHFPAPPEFVLSLAADDVPF
jgi:5-methylcytosine-specific restriction endonuclease McrA